jgi:hypothetical protein
VHDYTLGVINNPPAPLENALLAWEAWSVDGARVGGGSGAVSVAGVATSAARDAGIAPLVARYGVLVVKVTLQDGAGKLLSSNVYWPSSTPEGQQGLNRLADARVDVRAARSADGLDITLTNASKVPVLNAKLTLLTAAGERVLPVYWADNYVALMPGESRTVHAEFKAAGPLQVALRAWNSAAQAVAIP